MSYIDVFFYGALQGVSEFLPISSSAHLFLLERFFDLSHVPAFMETAVHFGSLGVLLVYFKKEVGRLIRGSLSIVAQRKRPEDTSFFYILVLSSLPAIFFGFFLNKTLGRAVFERLDVIAWMTLLFGALLIMADFFPQKYKMKDISPGQALLGWGLAQCLAFIHGVSRSGICITYGRLTHYKRQDAVRFAFLMALPTLAGASVLKGYALFTSGTEVALDIMALGVFSSFCVGMAVIYLMMSCINTPFLRILGAYRVVLGALLLAGIYGLGWH